MHPYDNSYPLSSLARSLRQSSTDWADVRDVFNAAKAVFVAFDTDPGRFSAAIDYALETLQPATADSTIVYDRVTLYESPDHQFSIRLMAMQPDIRRFIHNHRAPFATLILNGSYQHEVYSALGDISKRDATLRVGKNVSCRTEQPGHCYAISPEIFHCVTPTNDHLSLIVRGSSVLSHRFVFENQLGIPTLLDASEREQPPSNEATTNLLRKYAEQLRRIPRTKHKA